MVASVSNVTVSRKSVGAVGRFEVKCYGSNIPVIPSARYINVARRRVDMVAAVVRSCHAGVLSRTRCFLCVE